MRRWRQLVVGAGVFVLAVSGVARATGDPTMTSSSYSVVEGELGDNGDFGESSTNYQVNPSIDDGGATLGESATGNSSSTSYQTNSGFNTTAQPGLMFTVDSGSINFGPVTVGTLATQTVTFHVRDYTSYGYVVQIFGSTPANNGHSLTALSTDTAFNATQEQFGVNTVLNSVAGVGANPVQNPAGPPTFAYGVAGDGSTGTYGSSRPYTISDKWRFNSGDTVASAPQTSGNTDYTMTFMMNATSVTPGGTYTGGLSLVATGTY